MSHASLIEAEKQNKKPMKPSLPSMSITGGEIVDKLGTLAGYISWYGLMLYLVYLVIDNLI